MIKKTILLTVLFLFSMLFCVRGDESPPRGLFVSVIQDPPVLSNLGEIARLIDFARAAEIKILFVQIYRANQAWFPSNTADEAPYRACLAKVGEDPFALLIKEAHASGIEVHAWLNILSLSANEKSVFLKRYGNGILTRNLKKKMSLSDYKIDNQYFLEPGDPRVRAELGTMVEEILRAYPDLDGLQFDYIRYPDRNPAYGYTKVNIERFRKATGRAKIREGSDAWNNWKRAQVTGLLEELVRRVRAVRPGITVSATGCAPYVRAYHEAFQDWPSWVDRGVVDFVTLMSYSDDPAQFERYLIEARSKVVDFKKVYVAVGAYELTRAPEIFKKELALCEEARPGACVIFHYGSLLGGARLGDLLILGGVSKGNNDKGRVKPADQEKILRDKKL